MSEENTASPDIGSERRTLRWLLGGQVVLALCLVLTDAISVLPSIFQGSSNAPELNRPIQPGDQTRRYQPSNPSQPGTGIDPNMPSQLVLTTEGDGAVLLSGAISPGDGDRIIADLRRMRPASVALNSPGGSVSDALDIGRTLRDLNVTTLIGDDGVCFSACPYVFVGGTARRVENGGRFGVHQHSFGDSSILPAFLATQDIQAGQARALDHFDTMGIDLRIMGPALATPANEIYILSEQELSAWNVVTDDSEG